ncbi:MAG: ion transporter [Mycobacteriaceae bacterium]|nr:ion transporter [Mycobacteriaceae bacterium]
MEPSRMTRDVHPTPVTGHSGGAQARARTAIGWVDAVMAVLAVVSVGLLVWITVFDVPDGARRVVAWVDYGACAAFAGEFLWRWRSAGWGWRHPLLSWHEIIGMAPVASPLVRGFRLVRILVLLARRHRLWERILGARVTEALVARLAQTIVATTAESMERNRGQMEKLLVDNIHADPAVRRWRHLPFHDTMVRRTAEASYRIMLQTMTDPRTEDFVADVLRHNLDQVRVRVVNDL